MDNVLVVQVVDCLEYLLDRLRGILFRELALVANPVEELSTRCQLRHNIVFVLETSTWYIADSGPAHPRLEPIMKPDNVRMRDTLQHLQLVVNHTLISLDIFLENDLDCDLLTIGFGFAHDTVCSSTESASELVCGFLIVAVRLAVQAIDHSGDCEWCVSVACRTGRIQKARHIVCR